MIFLNFIEPIDSEWLQWVQECRDATQQLIQDYQSGHPINIKKLYAGQKHKYLDKPFNGKCAYCEADVEIDSPNIVEHFRPKGGVRRMDNSNVMITKNGNDQKLHPGYYWLAYDWKNLLPTCWKCNTWHKDPRSGKMIGKGNRFPVSNRHSINQRDNVDEGELLINPMFEDPLDHIYINNLGYISMKNGSAKGETVISIFGLNDREKLLEGRKTAYDNMKRKYKMMLCMDDSDPEKSNQIEELMDIKAGKSQFTMAARQALKDAIASEEKIIGIL